MRRSAPTGAAAGERPPRALGLDVSLPFRHAALLLCCMPGAMRDAPREGGPFRLSCWTVYVACHGEAASPGVGRAVYPTFLEGSCICLLVLLSLARWWTCKASSSHTHTHKSRFAPLGSVLWSTGMP